MIVVYVDSKMSQMFLKFDEQLARLVENFSTHLKINHYEWQLFNEY